MAKKRNAFYRPAWGVIAGGIWDDLPTMRRILTKLGVEWSEFSTKKNGDNDDVVMVIMNDEEVKKLPIDDETPNKDTGRKPVGLYRHYLPTFENPDGTYSGHTIYEVTLFQLVGLMERAGLSKQYNRTRP